MMNSLKNIVKLCLTLRADGSSILKWYTDASYAVHNDMKSHTGGTMTLGKVCPFSKSTKQKIATKSSTESELVSADDLMPQIIWTNYFLEHQGYNCKDTILYQDNRSEILLEKNGRASSGKRTKHINVRYFHKKI